MCSNFFEDGETRIKEIFEEFDPDSSGNIDYITWSMMLSPKVGP
jgi:Ca2+-binding EF-hand superfamily protein